MLVVVWEQVVVEPAASAQAGPVGLVSGEVLVLSLVGIEELALGLGVGIELDLLTWGDWNFVIVI